MCCFSRSSVYIVFHSAQPMSAYVFLCFFPPSSEAFRAADFQDMAPDDFGVYAHHHRHHNRQAHPAQI